MADDEINGVEVERAQTFSGKGTIDTALQLIRYDIPVLILGKSSIGKSYTLIDITKKWRIPHQLLYIGSEKSENIEGIPKLTDRGTDSDGKDKEALEYLQPYWFPNSETITASVKNGKDVFDRFVGAYWDAKLTKGFNVNYVNLESILNSLANLDWDNSMLQTDGMYRQDAILKDFDWIEGKREDARVLNPTKPFPLVKDGAKVSANDASYRQDDLADFLAYVRTVLGYGNYWLILDEIDKVMDEDHDKFAPLLHIVRERTLKSFSMIKINGGKGLGIPLGDSFKSGKYKNMIKDVNRLLESGESVLDTRVMAIANKTENIEEALFRRFVQLIAEEVMIWREQDHTQEQTLIEGCLSSVKDQMIGAGIDSGSLVPLPITYQRLDEINLQWQYNFFPKMLNDIDVQGNYFRANAIELLGESKEDGTSWDNEKEFSAFFNLLKNNFHVKDLTFKLPNKLFHCLEPTLMGKDSPIGESKKNHDEKVSGIGGIFKSKVDSLGLKLAAKDIANEVRGNYPERKDLKVTDSKENMLYAWTDRIIELLDTALKPDADQVKPIELAKYLIPALVNVFYTEIAKDKEPSLDVFVHITAKLQNFFADIYSLEPAFSLDCDLEMTEDAFYGGTKEELSDYSDIKLSQYAENTFFGASDKYWAFSASGLLTLTQMDGGLSLAMNFLPKEMGHEEALGALIEEEGSIPFLQKYYLGKLEEMVARYDKQELDNTAKGKRIAAANFKNASEFVTEIINADL